MINTEQIFKEFLAFIEKLEIEEREFIDDETQKSTKYVRSALSGLHTVAAIEVVVDCFFQRGFTNFKPHAKRILKEEGLYKLSHTMSYMAGELNAIFNKRKIKSVPLDTISFRDMQSRLNSQEYTEWKSAVKEGVATPALKSALKSAVEKAITDFPKRNKELLREFSSELIKAEFVVDKEFMREFGLDLYNALIDSGEMKGEFEDFQMVCKGAIPIQKIQFKQNSSLTTFINSLSDLSVLSKKKHYWTYLANDACELFNGNCDAESLRKNKNQNKNSKVLIAFENIRHKSP